MRLNQFISVAVTALFIPAGAWAESALDSSTPLAQPTAASPASADGLAWDQFDDPDFAPSTTAADSPVQPVPVVAASEGDAVEATESAMDPAMQMEQPVSQVSVPAKPGHSVVLGPEGVDGEGRTGRLHTVSRGDTLWDLSAAYLGTPWVWPSVWIDNDDIANPHLITPGDKIWITANEMRVVTDAEAESFLEPRVVESEVASTGNFDMPTDEAVPPLAALEGDDPSTLDAFPVAIPGQSPESMQISRQITVSRFETLGFISADALAGASSIVESPSERTYLSEGDKVFLGMGEGDVEVGDRFTAFQVITPVRDVETNRILGSHVEILGWIEVQELTGDTSIGEIRQSFSEIPRGARLIERVPVPRRVAMRSTPDAIEGQVVYLPTLRTLIADGGYVYINRGEFHGVEVGSHMEVFVSGEVLNDRERRVDVRTPDTAVAELVVVSVEEETAVAFVLNADRELEVGDHVRAVSSQLARR